MTPLAARFLAVTVAVAFLPAGDAPEADTVALVRALEDPSRDVRRRAAEALVPRGAKAVPDLLEVLGHKNPEVRLLATDVLGKIGPAAERAVPLLGRQLRDGDDAESAAAGRALARIGPAAVAVLVDVAGRMAERPRRLALEALAALEGTPDTVVPALAGPLAHEDVAVRRHAAVALFRMTTEPIAPVVRALRDADAQVRATARTALSIAKNRGSAELTKALEPLLHDPNPAVRGDALQVLAHSPDAAMKYGLPCLKDADAGVRGLAVQLLNTAMAPVERNPYTVARYAAQIAPVLTDPSPEVRKVAFLMMQRSRAEGVPHLAGLLDAKDGDVRKLAVETLLYNGPEDADRVAAKLLDLARRDPDVAIRAAAVHSYCRLGTSSIPALVELFREERVDPVRAAAIQALSLHKEEVAFLTPDFIAALKDDNPEVRRAAAQAFYWMTTSGKRAIPALTAALGDKDAQVRGQAIYTLGVLTPESEPGIIAGIKSDDRRVREMALHTFWQAGLKDKAALPWLIQALKEDGQPNVRHNAIYAVANLGADARDAIPALEAITDPAMRVHVRYGLERIRGVARK